MKKAIWVDNRERYDELNPMESASSKLYWTIGAICLAVVVMLFAL